MERSAEEHAVVIGGAGGIGEAVVRRLRARAVPVTVMDLLDPDAAGAGAGSADGDGDGDILRLRVDVTRPDSVEDGFARAAARFGTPNRLVVSAGAHGQLLPAVRLDIEAWQRLMDVHVKGTLLAAGVFGRRLLAEREGVDAPRDAALVALGSTTGITASRGQGDYGPAKAALAQFVRVLAVEWAAAGIRANVVAAGQTLTPFVAKMVADGYDPAPTLARTPLGRLALPDEVAAAVEFLLLDATFVTGVSLPVDGGWTALGR